MPKKGYSSLTVNRSIYEYFKSIYDKEKPRLSLVGVTSFSGFISWVLGIAIHNDVINTKVKQRIKELLEVTK